MKLFKILALVSALAPLGAFADYTCRAYYSCSAFAADGSNVSFSGTSDRSAEEARGQALKNCYQDHSICQASEPRLVQPGYSCHEVCHMTPMGGGGCHQVCGCFSH